MLAELSVTGTRLSLESGSLFVSLRTLLRNALSSGSAASFKTAQYWGPGIGGFTNKSVNQ